jgi:hypothetical protein
MIYSQPFGAIFTRESARCLMCPLNAYAAFTSCCSCAIYSNVTTADMDIAIVLGIHVWRASQCTTGKGFGWS